MLVVFIGTFYAAGELFADWWLLQVFVVMTANLTMS